MKTGPIGIGFIGTGNIGAPIAGQLLRAGYELVVHDLRPEAAAPLLQAGARWGDSPASLAEGCEVVVTCLPGPKEMEAVCLGAGNLVAALKPGALYIDHTTNAPSLVRRVCAILAKKGVAMIDAPVSGGMEGAQTRDLLVMAGGEKAAFERARPLLETMGALVLHVGPSGHGQMIKLINNTLAAINAAGLGEGLGLAQTAGIDTDKLLQVVAAGSGASTMATLKAAPMVERDFEPLFKLEHMLKDVRHCIAEADALGVDLPMAKLAESLYSRAAENGLGSRDFAAVMEVVAPRNP